jgi:hypothetical protein
VIRLRIVARFGGCAETASLLRREEKKKEKKGTKETVKSKR